MESGIGNKVKILFISSVDPTRAAGRLGLDYYKAFKEQQFEIDFLTKYPVKGYEEILFVCDEASTVGKKRFYLFFLKAIRKCLRVIFKRILYPLPGYYFFYKEDILPPVNSAKVLKSIRKQYDLVIILFWQELLSAKTVWDIYEKLKCPVFFRAVDYSPMTGGCHFFHDCRRYEEACGCCPAWNSKDEKDFTHLNLLYRMNVYHKINPVIFCNNYVGNIVKNSRLFCDKRVEKAFPIINEKDFCPSDKSFIRNEFAIPDCKKFIIFFGCQILSDERKGMKYLLEALNIFSSSLNMQKREEILVIVAGRKNNELIKNIPFQTLEMGYVDFEILPRLYSVADVFLSPSIIEAGPMMVNQSLSCGTPVVAFEIGTALEVIKNQGTGYCAKMKDSQDFASGIARIFSLDESSRRKMAAKCREIALKTTSYESGVKQIMDVYYNINNFKEL